MASLFPGFEYDIFISYRQKDNKGDRWVSEFVEALKTELEATFKEEISVYFDINPHDGLLETHDVDASLKDKLKCLVFIPVISRTYCDPKSFAWEHEFKAFIDQASHDQFGLKVKLPSGNVASRILPVRIHDLENVDVKLCESVLGGVMRGVEFIYKESGVNKPLTHDDDDRKNLNNTKYRIQINKTANAIKEIFSGFKTGKIVNGTERKGIQYNSEKSHLSEKSIVVLPFENLSSDPDQGYFSDGLTEELITKLSKVQSLRVISRTSAFMFKDAPKNVRFIAQELNVEFVLEGSVRKSGNKLRITAQLIDATTDAHIWAETYDGIIDNVFDIQEKVALAMVDALQLKLTVPEELQIAMRPIPNIQAHDFYLRASDVMYRGFTAEGINEAIQFLDSGLRITGDNPLLLATLANVYLQAVRIGVNEEADLSKAQDYADRALKIDPSMAKAHTVLGYIQWLRGNPEEYYRLVKHALLLDPNDIDTVMWAFWLFIFTGRTSRALDLTRHMIELDPVHPYRSFYPAVVIAFEGRFELAVEELRRHVPAAVLEQPAWLAWLGSWLVYAGRADEAREVLEPIEKVAASDVYVQISRLMRFALKGERNHLDEVVSGNFRAAAKRDCFISCIVSGAYIMLGDPEEAIYWVENAVEHGFINYPYLSQHDPLISKLNVESRFKKLIQRVRYEWEKFEE